MDWKHELAVAHLVKEAIARVDVRGQWENTLPEAPATTDQLQGLEEQLGFGLDAQLREFLRHANGWRAFKGDIDVFGVADFVGAERAQRADALARSLEPLDQRCGLRLQDVFPFAVSSNDIDVMLMGRPHTDCAGCVLWCAGGLIEKFDDFNVWFLAMVGYLRLDYRDLVERRAR